MRCMQASDRARAANRRLRQAAQVRKPQAAPAGAGCPTGATRRSRIISRLAQPAVGTLLKRCFK
jgi:hypothetical protein